jgi:hypothetical protein
VKRTPKIKPQRSEKSQSLIFKLFDIYLSASYLKFGVCNLVFYVNFDTWYLIFCMRFDTWYLNFPHLNFEVWSLIFPHKVRSL